jgi:uncharacterized protein YggE
MEKLLHNTEKNKNALYLAGAIALAMLALAGLIYAVREVRYMVGQPVGTTYITVSGKGEKQAAPDIAQITFTLRAEAVKVADAQKQIKDKTGSAVTALKDLKVEEKDIKTISYNSYPKYEYKQVVCRANYCPPAGNPTIVGYEVTQSVEVKVRDVDQVGTVFEKLGTLGINELSGPNFTVDDIEKIKAEARGLAIEDAQAKAKLLAKQLGLDIIRLSSFDDGTSQGGYPSPMYEKASLMSAEGGAVTGDAANGIMQGQNTITANVSLVFEVKAD